MKSVCANCDLGLKRSACNEDEYIENIVDKMLEDSEEDGQLKL